MRVLAIIPAKMDSKRLAGKNLKTLQGKTLVEHSIEYAKSSKYNPTIVISSESSEVEEVAQRNRVEFFSRPDHLLGDAEVADVYVDVCERLSEVYDIVVALQPDNPNRSNTLDECIDYFIENNYDDLITVKVGEKLKRSGSVRIIRYEHLRSGYMSRRIGCIEDNATDIHTQEDLNSIL